MARICQSTGGPAGLLTRQVTSYWYGDLVVRIDGPELGPYLRDSDLATSTFFRNSKYVIRKSTGGKTSMKQMVPRLIKSTNRKLEE